VVICGSFFVFSARFADPAGEGLGEGVGAGLDQAGPYAAAGSDCLVAAAAIDSRAAAGVLLAWCAPGSSQAHTPSAMTPAQRMMNLRRQ
jgi:hypothetical protein